MFEYKENINRVSFELSNLCQYATLHKQCPLHLTQYAIILPQKIVLSVIDTISSWGYSGVIGFHTYNEPGIDPRLFMFITYARTKCPSSHIVIMTNGFYLDDNLVNEYMNVGVNEMFLSAYSDKEYKRFSNFTSQMKININKPVLDERLDIYDRPEMQPDQKTCLAPYNELMVTREGYVGLCCLDWRRDNVFGNLHNNSLEEILTSEKMISAYENLSCGNRVFDICKRCGWSR